MRVINQNAVIEKIEFDALKIFSAYILPKDMIDFGLVNAKQDDYCIWFFDKITNSFCGICF